MALTRTAAQVEDARRPVPVSQRGAPATEDRDGAAARAALAGSADSDVQEIVDLLHNVCQVRTAAVGVLEGTSLRYVVSAGASPLESDAADIASAPIVSPGGVTVGRLCLLDDDVQELAPVQLQALATLADSVSSILDLRLRKRASAEAAEAAAAKGAHDEVVSVASQVSHDLRAPLTALGTSLALLDESTPEDETPLRRGLLASARRSATRMSGLVDGLLRLNDTQRGLDLAPVDLYDAAQQVLTDLESTLSEAEAQVTLGPLPVVRADADLVSVCLLNLVSNAVKFARPGHPPEIVVAARRTSGRIRVTVRDNGIGIAPEDRTRVFALFSRLTQTAGHGIGLTTVARVAEAHGGRAGVDDTPTGVGTDIWFEIPD